MMDALLEVRDLTVTLRSGSGEVTALDQLSFNVNRGEVLGLVGESGAGKSLTGAAIVDLLVPPLKRTGGRISLGGERLDGLSEEALASIRGKRVGYIFQDPLTSLNPVLTVGYQLAETIAIHTGMDRAAARQRALEWISRVGISDPERRYAQYPHHFSGGMRQRLVIALALCGEPDLVIADEPTTALDVSVQAHILTLLKRLHEETGTAIILITHDLGVIAKMADRTGVLYAGRLVEIGPTSQVLLAPRHPYTQGLMRATPDHRSTTARLSPIRGSMPGLGRAPSGCPFRTRCDHAEADCAATRPELVLHGLSDAACHHPLGLGVAT
ncbi:methionine ABC transporter ATP-binding protein [Mesorhizobium loti]|nr:ABC transporter ATP-binding protein [Mesorhizobium loti]PLP56664.1 methionine ABC transporter ATP-binding protein [Mesorhizobium loti]